MPSPSEEGRPAFSSDALALSDLEADVVRLAAGEAETVRERAAIVLERARIDEERAAWEQARGDLQQRCVWLEDRCASLEHERDELRADRDAVLGRLNEVTDVLARREAEWNAASAEMDQERARWLSEEAGYARQRDQDRALLERARRFSPRHRVGVLLHRLRG